MISEKVGKGPLPCGRFTGSSPNKALRPQSLVACKVFGDALQHIGVQRRFPGLDVRYLPAHLHLNPFLLQKRIAAEIEGVRQGTGSVCCLYGNCFPDIDNALRDLSAFRADCGHCYEALLGSRRYGRIIDEDPGTFFLEKEMILHFEDHCWRPLELDDPQMREWCFAHYSRAVYIRQPLDGAIEPAARAAAARLDFPLLTFDADYSELEERLFRVLSCPVP